MRNKFEVGAVGRRVSIGNLPARPELTPREALELAAWLVATAAPLAQGEPADVLSEFLKLVGDAGDEETSAAALELRE